MRADSPRSISSTCPVTKLGFRGKLRRLSGHICATYDADPTLIADDVAAMFGVSQRTVLDALLLHGVKARRRRAPKCLAERLAEATKPDANGCHLWIRGRGGRGYGQITIAGRLTPAHRAAWELANGPIPAGLIVCHKCDVRNCINPDHLFLGTHLDNQLDKIAKGRGNQRRGEAHHRSSISDSLARAIKSATGTRCDVAARFGVSRATVSNIRLERHRFSLMVWSPANDPPTRKDFSRGERI